MSRKRTKFDDMSKNKSRYTKKGGEKCSYKDFLVMLPYCAENVQKDLLERLQAQPRPFSLCDVEVPRNLNALSYGTLDDLRSATAAEDPICECVRILLDVGASELMDADVNDVFGFLSFVKAELEKINKLFADIKHTYSKEEEAAGVHDLDFGSFGVLDWYARRMGITNQNDVRDVAWVRIYQCMKNDCQQAEYEKRVHKQYMDNMKTRRR